jgi:hypothetical protein
MVGEPAVAKAQTVVTLSRVLAAARDVHGRDARCAARESYQSDRRSTMPTTLIAFMGGALVEAPATSLPGLIAGSDQEAAH